jgi:prepilin-type processing-associated H-X9-DG protein
MPQAVVNMKRHQARSLSPTECSANASGAAGFTLVEMIIVIGVIMLLAGLLFPVLSRARENGKRTACMSNLKQIALGIQQYAQDNNRRYPLPGGDVANGLENWLWSAAIISTIKNPDVFQCPSELSANSGTDYWINGNLLGKSDARVRVPASVILNADGDAHPADYALAEANPSPPTDPGAWEKWSATADYATRHLGGANYSFVDGHVKFLKPDQVSTTASPDGSNFSLLIN